jgi:hypothetical protein
MTRLLQYVVNVPSIRIVVLVLFGKNATGDQYLSISGKGCAIHGMFML